MGHLGKTPEVRADAGRVTVDDGALLELEAALGTSGCDRVAIVPIAQWPGVP